MKFAEWNTQQTDFKRLKDSPTGKIRGGHADALAALIYLHRSVVKSHNPYPKGYGEQTGSNIFQSLLKKEHNSGDLASVLSQMFGQKNKKP
jgi:hypothetical protein